MEMISCAVSLIRVKCWQHLAEIHRAPFSKVGGLPEHVGARRIFFVQTAQVVGELVFARKRNVAQFRLQPLLENRKVLRVKIATTFLLAHEREKQAGVHSFGSLFHLLTGEHAAKVFPQNDVHPGPQFCEKQYRIGTHRQDQDEDWSQPQEDTSLHHSKSAILAAAGLAVKCQSLRWQCRRVRRGLKSK